MSGYPSTHPDPAHHTRAYKERVRDVLEKMRARQYAARAESR